MSEIIFVVFGTTHPCTLAHTTTNHKPTNQYHTHMLTKANTIKIDKSQSEIGRLLRLYYAKDNIDDELEFSKQRIETLRRRGRLDTPEGSYLQQKITGLEPSVELRKVVVGRPRPPSRLTHLPRALPSHSPDIYIYIYVVILRNPLTPSLFTHRISTHTATMTCATIRHPMLHSSVLTWSHQLRYHSPDCTV